MISRPWCGRPASGITNCVLPNNCRGCSNGRGQLPTRRREDQSISHCPREVLCEQCPAVELGKPSVMAPAHAAPDQKAVAEAARLLAGARKPLIIAQRGAGSQGAFDALHEFVEEWAIPVSHYWANMIAIPMTSPMHVDWSPDDLLQEADVVLVINSLAPWWPDRSQPGPEARVIHLGPDPLFARSTPIRNFRSDISLVARPRRRCGR